MKILNKWISFLTIILTLIVVQTSFGQKNDSDRSKFGLGVSLFNLSDYEFNNANEHANSIYLTFEIGDKFRLEPAINFVYLNRFYYSLEIGAFLKKPISKFNMLYGLRLGYINFDMISIAPTIGGEYFFIRSFSIGSEVQLKGLYDTGGMTLYTNSSVIIRFYF